MAVESKTSQMQRFNHTSKAGGVGSDTVALTYTLLFLSIVVAKFQVD